MSGFTSCTSQRQIVFSVFPTPPEGINSDFLAVSQKHINTKPSATFLDLNANKTTENKKPTTPKPECNSKTGKALLTGIF